MIAKRLSTFLPGIAAAIALTVAGGQAARADGEVNVYSYRQPFLVQPLFDTFEKETGAKVNVIFASKGLIERMAEEGESSPADVLLTVDIGRLEQAVTAGVAQPVKSDVLTANIPAEFRDDQGRWFALTTRARVVYASRERVKQDSITYAELADPKWKGRVCIRSGQHEYNLGLIASIIANEGEEQALKWLEGLKANLARKPGGNDRGQIKSVYSGECDIALANTYYMGAMQTNEKEPEQKEWAAAVRILFPDKDTRGTHVNVSGVVMAKYAPNRDNALKLMEFLASDEAQRIYAELNFEYPVKPGVAWSDRVKSWGDFKPDTISLGEVAKRIPLASEMVDQVRFNE
jgi:iron(III) transport system substrate-binding protein